MRFSIFDREFTINSAILDAFIDDDEKCVTWGIEIESEGYNWNLRAYSETLFSTKTGDINNWLDSGGKNVDWTDPLDEENEPRGVLYIFQHAPVYNSKIRFELLNREVFLSWCAKCDINWNEKYSQNLDMKIETPLQFRGVWLGRKSEKECILIAEKYFDLTQFRYVCNENRVSRLVPA